MVGSRDAKRPCWPWHSWHTVLPFCGEPGVCIEFEESEDKLAANLASLGLDLHDLSKRKKLLVDHVRIDRNEIEEAGEYI